MMQIGEFGERTGMSARTIRHYDEVGLLQPSGRTIGGFRLYTAKDVEEMLLIRRMKPLGYTLEEMGRLLAVFRALQRGTGDRDALQADVAAFLEDAETRRARLRQHLDWADEFVDVVVRLRSA